MNGLEIARLFCSEYVEPMLAESFASERQYIAIGLSGQGSECLGFDDDLSRDHDFGPGVCLWIPRSMADTLGADLSAAYDKLPKSIPECQASQIDTQHSQRIGVQTIEGFYEKHIGRPDAPKSNIDWLYLPEKYLSQACSGAVFSDPCGEFSRIRNELLRFYPEDVLKKKLAANCACMAQAGQHNYNRCVQRRDFAGAYLACAEFVRSALAALFLLNGIYMPFYKWAFRAACDFSCLKDCVALLRELTAVPDLTGHSRKAEMIEKICLYIEDELIRRGWSDGGDTFMQYHADKLMKSIQDERIRSLPIMFGGAGN